MVSGVRSSWETSETKRRCTRLSSSSWRIWRCRLVAIWLNDVASRARSSSPVTRIRSWSWPAASRSATRRASRTGVTTCRVTSQVSAGDQDQQQDARGQQGARDQPERVLLLVEREQVVERALRPVGRDRDLGAHHDPRRRRVCGLPGEADGRVRPRFLARGVEVTDQGVRDAVEVELRGVLRAAVGQRRPGGCGAGHHDPEPTDLPARVDRLQESAGLVAGVGVGGWDRGQPGGGLVVLVAHLGQDRVDAAVDQAVLDLAEEEPADRRYRHPHHQGQRPAWFDGQRPQCSVDFRGQFLPALNFHHSRPENSWDAGALLPQP